MLEVVVLEPRVFGLVEHGQRQRFEVDRHDVPLGVLARLGLDPAREAVALASLAGADGDDHQFVHGWPFRPGLNLPPKTATPQRAK